jgi:hypothetical protein
MFDLYLCVMKELSTPLCEARTIISLGWQFSFFASKRQTKEKAKDKKETY